MNRFSFPEFEDFSPSDFRFPDPQQEKEIQNAAKDGSAIVKHGQIMIDAPLLETMFHSYRGRDFFIIILQHVDQRSIRVKEIRSLKDIPWRFISPDKMPEDMFFRLSANTPDIVELIKTAQWLKAKNSDLEKSHKHHVSEWNSLVELRIKNIEGFKKQKREIKKILAEKYHIKITPGSELSKLLRLDNIPEDFAADRKEGTYR